MNDGGNSLPRITKAEHIGPADTGDNIEAKRVAGYVWDGANWQRPPLALLDKSFDYVGFSNADANGNYQTLSFKTGGAAGTTQRTLSLTYDASNNVTSVTRS